MKGVLEELHRGPKGRWILALEIEASEGNGSESKMFSMRPWAQAKALKGGLEKL